MQAGFFEDGQNQFFGGAGISGGFQHDQLALLQVGLNGQSSLLDVAQVGFAALIERRGHADDDGIAFFQFFEIGGGAKMLAVHKLLNLGLLNVLDVGLAGIEHGHFFGIGVKTRNFVAGFGEAQGQRQSHISAANDAYFELGAFEKFGFPVDGHEFVIAPRSIVNFSLTAMRFLRLRGPRGGEAEIIKYNSFREHKNNALQCCLQLVYG